MEFLIITGLSGAGKSRAADVLEDLEYYCVDNMPLALMPRFAELCLDAHGRYDKVALVTDVRERDGFGELLGTLEELKAMDCTVRILYMDADLRTLVRRYKESRRPHPLAGKGITLEQAVQKEMELLAPIRERADFIINSSQLTLGQLQNRMFSLFAGTQKKRELQVTVMSFGYKHGIPLDADLVFDVRFLPNPFYVEELRPLSGLDRLVAEFVFSYPDPEVHGDDRPDAGFPHAPLCGGGQGQPDHRRGLHRRPPPQRGHRRRHPRLSDRQGHEQHQRQPGHREVKSEE